MTNPAKKNVAAIITEYRHWSHADVIIGKILEGYNQDGGAGPGLRVVSMYVDQFPANDLSRDLAKKHGFKIYRAISEALTLGGNQLAVDGVLCIGEHGNYFFFQAEDGIRDIGVTGVQTCALPISPQPRRCLRYSRKLCRRHPPHRIPAPARREKRSEERRVGKEWRFRGLASK